MSQPDPLIYHALVLLQQIKNLSDSNKALRAIWMDQDQVMGSVVDLFTQCKSSTSTTEDSAIDVSETVPMQLIHSLILDLLAGVSETRMAQASLPDVCFPALFDGSC